MKKYYSTTLLFILLGLRIAYSQSGGLDISFDPGLGANGVINTVAIQNDGKIIIGGDFTSYNGVSRNRIARINTDGSLDTSFNVGTGFNMFSGVQSLAIDSNEKIVVVGGFTSYNNITKNHIVRLNTDGTIDNSFSIGTGANNPINALAIQSDGKIIIGGGFTSFNGNTVNRLLRLNEDGSIDSSFNTNTKLDSFIFSIGIQSDDKIIIGGVFTKYTEITVNRIARINPDGTLDTSFNIGGSGGNNYVRGLKIQSDGKILIGGLFTTFNGNNRKYIARINPDGSLDNTFDTQIGANGLVSSIATQFNDKIVFGGVHSTFNNISSNKITRLNSDGQLDTDFESGTAANNNVNTIAVQEDGNIIMAGNFTTYNGTTRNRIARIFGDEPLVTENFVKNSFNIYPNPSNSLISLQTNSNSIESIKIYDATGKLIFTKSKPEDYKIDVSNFASGVYLITMQNEYGVFTEKFMKN